MDCSFVRRPSQFLRVVLGDVGRERVHTKLLRRRPTARVHPDVVRLQLHRTYSLLCKLLKRDRNVAVSCWVAQNVDLVYGGGGK